MQDLIKAFLFLILLSCSILVVFSIQVVLIDLFNKFSPAGEKNPPDTVDFLIDFSWF